MGTKFTISDLKKQLGPGLGLRKNRYMIEIPATVDGETLNILCQSAGFPERNIQTVEMFHKGRKYLLRGETDYTNEYEITILDDSSMQIRQMFDNWLKEIDNSRPDKNSSLLGASFETLAPGLIDNLEAGVKVAGEVKNALKNTSQIVSFARGLMDFNAAVPGPKYQVDINIWQIDAGQKTVYGYKLQNAFPKSVGSVTFEDSDENTLTEFTVTFAFSEYIELRGTKEDLISGIIGDQTSGVLSGASNLFK